LYKRLPLRIMIMNNGYLGMVRQWQQMFFGRRYSGTPITGPDFVKLADAYGIKGFRVTERKDVIPMLEQVRQTDGPVLVDFVVKGEENVYPMVPSGGSISDMMRRPLEEEETA
jgi:acetolactate synthase-1/2/3 large subunit